MSSAFLCLGSNCDASHHMERAATMLCAHFADIRLSPLMETEAIGDPAAPHYLNQVAILHTEELVEEVRAALKQMEWEIGRRPADKASGQMPIDIDLIQWNDQILKPADLERPFVRELMAMM